MLLYCRVDVLCGLLPGNYGERHAMTVYYAYKSIQQLLHMYPAVAAPTNACSFGVVRECIAGLQGAAVVASTILAFLQ
jgi:hypothetical protein